MLRLAQAASSENFGKWGMPPNQRRTGVTKDKPGGNMDGELNIVPFYGGWEKIFRPIDPNLAENIAWMMTRVVMNGKYGGYSQNNTEYPRTGLFDELAKLKIDIPDPMLIKTLFNSDCSASMGACVYHSGVKDYRLRDVWTGNQVEILTSTKVFVVLTDPLLLSIGTGLRRGDILWKPGHTAIAIDSDDHYMSVPYWISNCYACNLRSEPDMGDNIIDVLHNGDIVEVVSTASIDEWKHVKTLSGKDGYVYRTYCSTPLDSVVAKGDVWLRETAGTDGNPIIVMQKGETVYVTGKTTRVGIRIWKQCIYANHLGWASSLYV